MALFQKKPIDTDNVPLYTLGANKSVLIIGLGNPGDEHQRTRHNIGFAVIDHFAKENNFPSWHIKNDLKCQLSLQTLGETRVILCKPSTYMNNSGEAASAVQRFYRVYNVNTLVIYDELAIPFGQLRSRMGGSDAGHNGVKSLITHLGDDFARLRVGIGTELAQKADSASFVLDKFSKLEQEKLPLVTREATAMITEYIFSGQLPHDTRKIF